MPIHTSHSDTIGTLYKQHYTDLLCYLKSLTTDHQLAEDIVQDVFLTLIKKLETVDIRYVKPFLIKSTKNRLIDYYRKSKPVLCGDERLTEALNGSDSFEPSVEETELIGDVLNRLPAHYRRVIIARDYFGYSYQDIADLTGVTRSCVKTKIFRARKQFIRHYEEEAAEA